MVLPELAEAEEQLRTEVHTMTSPQSEPRLAEMLNQAANGGIKTTDIENRGPAKKSIQSRKDSLQQVVS